MISLYVIVISIGLAYWLPAWAVPGLIAGLIWAYFDLRKMARREEESAGDQRR